MEPEYTIKNILGRYFGCKKVFLKQPRLIGQMSESGEKEYEYMTANGARAYEKLVDLVQEMGVLLNARDTATRWVRELDRITNEGYRWNNGSCERI